MGPVDDEGQLVSEQYEIFCAIATTECDAFKDVKSADDRKETRSVTNTTEPQNNGRAQSQSHRGRPRLSMSAAPQSQVTHVMLEASASQRQPSKDEPLFLGNDDERQAEVRMEDARPPASQTVRPPMTEEEVMRISGFGALTAQDVFDALDDAEDEDEREEMNTQQRVEGQGGLVMNRTIDGISEIVHDGTIGDFSLSFGSPEHAPFDHDQQASPVAGGRQNPPGATDRTDGEEYFSDEEMDESQKHPTVSMLDPSWPLCVDAKAFKTVYCIIHRLMRKASRVHSRYRRFRQ